MNKRDIDIMVAAAVRAPSGENCQPWRFVLKGNTLFLYNIPERDVSPYNFNQLGSLVSHGAAIENIVITASTLGYRATATLFPIPAEDDCTASITFDKIGEGVAADELNESIAQRASNRTAYDPTHRIDVSTKEYIIQHAVKNTISAQLVFVDDPEQKRTIGGVLSYGDRLLFENRAVHDFLFAHIYWNLAEAKKKKSGFYVKELALRPPQEFIFKLLKKEFFRRFFVRIGLPAMAAKENAALYEHASVLGAVLTKGNSPMDFIEAGRLMERTWLAATAKGYDIQLLTAIAFFHQRILGNAADDFSGAQIDGITESYTILARAFVAGEDTIALMFRMGKGKPIPHRSLRLDPILEYHP